MSTSTAILGFLSFVYARSTIAPAILSALGDCYVEKENPDYNAAAKAFEKAASASNSNEFSPLYLRKAGLVYEKTGDNAKALKAYEAIKKNWPDSDLANSIASLRAVSSRSSSTIISAIFSTRDFASEECGKPSRIGTRFSALILNACKWH